MISLPSFSARGPILATHTYLSDLVSFIIHVLGFLEPFRALATSIISLFLRSPSHLLTPPKSSPSSRSLCYVLFQVIFPFSFIGTSPSNCSPCNFSHVYFPKITFPSPRDNFPRIFKSLLSSRSLWSVLCFRWSFPLSFIGTSPSNCSPCNFSHVFKDIHNSWLYCFTNTRKRNTCPKFKRISETI